MSKSVTAESGFLEVNGAKLYYEVAGEGHPFLMVHAGVADHTMWDAQVEEFSGSYKVITYDTRGFGKSVTEDVEFSNRQDIYSLLKHLGIDNTYVMGLSRGGQIALDFTLEHPAMVDALIVVAGGISGFQPGATEEEMTIFNRMEATWSEAEKTRDFAPLAALEADVWGDGPGQPAGRSGWVRDSLRDMTLQKYTGHQFEGIAQVLEPPAAERLDEVKVPTLVICGDLDFTGTQESMKKLGEEIAGAQYHVVEGTAHMVNMEKPEEFNAIVRSFLETVKQ